MKKRELADRLLATFLSELEEQVRGMNVDLLALEKDPADPERLQSLFRAAHTLKGAARAAAVPSVERLCHEMESLLGRARDGTVPLGDAEFARLFAGVDALADAAGGIRGGGTRAEGALPEPDRPPVPAASVAPQPPPPPAARPAANGEMPAAGAGRVRVEAERLEALVSNAVQLQATSQRVLDLAAELEERRDSAAGSEGDWRGSVRTLRAALEAGEAPAAALRALDRLQEHLRRLTDDAGRFGTEGARAARSLRRRSAELTERVHRLLLRPFSDACEGLPRMVRDLAAAEGKAVEFEIRGGGVEAEPEVWAAVREALLHLVRNAVDHGIEPPDERERAGKPRNGTVSVAARLRGDRIVVTVSDDGAGLDLGALRARLAERGAPVPESERELAGLLFRGGISTRGEITAISGRGVGLEAVRAAAHRIRGSVDVSWRRGEGTTFTLECPPTLTSASAVVATAGSQTFAVPSADVERLARVAPGEVRRLDGRDVVAGEEGPVPLVSLARVLGPSLTAAPPDGPAAVLFLRSGGRRLAVAVDALVAEAELMIRPLKRIPSPPEYLSGVAILGTGEVALVLNAAVVVRAGLDAAPGPGGTAGDEERPTDRRRRIMVADDSITTRTLEQSLLEAAGYEVVTAADGAEGWRIVQEGGCDLVVTDVEMPRMDGFALCAAIRASKRHRELPVVLVTALETPEHRARGLEVGADAYLAKSSFDQDLLLDTIRQLVG